MGIHGTQVYTIYVFLARLFQRLIFVLIRMLTFFKPFNLSCCDLMYDRHDLRVRVLLSMEPNMGVFIQLESTNRHQKISVSVSSVSNAKAKGMVHSDLQVEL